MDPQEREELRQAVAAVEEQAQGLVAALGRLRALLDDGRPGLPEPTREERRRLPDAERLAVRAAPVEGELDDDEPERATGPFAQGPAPEQEALPPAPPAAASKPGRRQRRRWRSWLVWPLALAVLLLLLSTLTSGRLAFALAAATAVLALGTATTILFGWGRQRRRSSA